MRLEVHANTYVRTYVRNLWAPYGVGVNSPAHGYNAVQE